MPRPDEAHLRTDRLLQALERRIARVYREARDELDETVKAYFESFRARDEAMKKRLDAGEITKEHYLQWRLNQIGRGKRFEALAEKMAERYTHANEIAIAYINGDMASIYAMNRSFIIGDCIQQSEGLLVEGDFIAFDESTVKRLIVEDPDLMPNYPEEKAIKRGIDLAYGKKQITASVTSGILQGKSVGKIADELQRRIADMNRVSAIRSARTAVTEAENAGRFDATLDLEERGAILEKEWIATNDGRTRHDHRRANGQQVPVSVPFIVSGEKLMYPGDKKHGASPRNLYNCRCRYVTHVVGFKPTLTDAQKKRANLRRVS